ncbi:hypothetical protein [Clostridium estertheticum]|uniref:Uncharacterized protein n=1 Tax=Clostridium estertheticum TaxID=238834 RepID=A0A7Y3WRV9_9CLOT|nr:hypothetical protein [Clostridium estertheticum]NNU75315.1 hypothetical protein [Clostridium estertheticum]WBL48216.1 hypothetical protein LOR37_06045 [Clostridium estertheticum]
MNKKEYFKSTLEEQVNYINQKMNEGKSFNDTCKEILLLKGAVLNKFKKHGYKLIEGQYILKQMPEKHNLNEDSIEPSLDEVVSEIQDAKEILENLIVTQESEIALSLSNENENIENENIENENTEEGINPAQSITSKGKNNDNKEKKTKLKAKVGRPQKYKKDHEGKNIDKKKFTLEIDKKVYKALKHKKTEEGIAINLYVEDLLRKDIEDKYFRKSIK